MKKSILVFSLLALVGGAVWFVQSRAPAEDPTPETTNVALMESTTKLPVVTEDAVAYFPQAKGFVAQPEAPGNYPGIVMIHENRGLRPEIKQAAEELAQEGYIVLAVDLYKGTVMETQDEARAYRDKFVQAEGIENLKAAVTYLEAQGATKLASLGWCFGGKQALELAISGVSLDATVVYYGGGMATSTEQLTPISWPVLGVFGNQDQVIPVQMVNDLESSLNTLNIENEIYLYEGVGHAFANPSNPNFAPEATSDAWVKTLAFLKKNLQ